MRDCVGLKGGRETDPYSGGHRLGTVEPVLLSQSIVEPPDSYGHFLLLFLSISAEICSGLIVF